MPSTRALPLVAALVLASLGAVLVPAVAVAQQAGTVNKEAEKLRLIEEMNRLAAKNAWAGVERSYMALLDLNIDLPFDVHYMGAQSARYLGKTWEVYQRLESAKALKAQEDVVTGLQAIDEAYGRVRIKGDPRRKAALVREAMPFAPDERKSIEWAQTVVVETGSFEGMLPFGPYQIEGCPAFPGFEVKQGKEWQIVEIPKKCGQKGETIVYTGPIFVIGPAYGMTPTPEDPGDGQPHPVGISEAGVVAAAGGEVGFSKTFGVAATIGYQGLFGGDTVHGVTGWLAAAIRPGDLRIAVGPTWGYVGGGGSGVAPYWLEGKLDEAKYNRDTLHWTGHALAGGAQLTAGYGLLDFGKLQGVVELGGAWQTDSVRNYMGFGLRFGIVPMVPRFKG
jgi:hypothetical protein